MKSFNQFLQESYLNEEVPAGMTRDQFNALPAESRRKLSGGSSAAYGKKGQPLQGAASDPAIRSARQSRNAVPEPTPKPYVSPGQGELPLQGKTTSPSGGGGGKTPSGPKLPKLPAGAGKVLRVAGRIAGPAAAALDVADERSKGSGWLRSGLKAATVAAGGALGGAAGSIGGPVGSFAGATGGAVAASKAFDVAAGANAKERAAMAAANRRSQSGAALTGIGGKTTFDTKKNTMTTGVGPQRKTVQLAKTSVVTGPKGKQETGYLAYKGGQAVYKRGADPSTLAKTSSNPLERIGRSLFAGAYKKSDAAAAAKKLDQARQSDIKRQQALGVKFKPGG